MELGFAGGGEVPSALKIFVHAEILKPAPSAFAKHNPLIAFA
jgi:hypothetical protein